MIEIYTADREIDITQEVCPMTFVRTRLALDRMLPGQILLVRLRGDEPLKNVPRTAREQGHGVLSVTTSAWTGWAISIAFKCFQGPGVVHRRAALPPAGPHKPAAARGRGVPRANASPRPARRGGFAAAVRR